MQPEAKSHIIDLLDTAPISLVRTNGPTILSPDMLVPHYSSLDAQATISYLEQACSNHQTTTVHLSAKHILEDALS